MIKAIFFDFNGVIIDDERLQMSAYQDILREQGIELTEPDYYASLGMDDKKFVQAAFERTNKNLSSELLTTILEDKTNRHRKTDRRRASIVPGRRHILEGHVAPLFDRAGEHGKRHRN